jgi:hypothetical protein
VHPEQLKAAAIRKQDGHAPLVLALCHYIDERLTVQVFPWVVGISGLINSPLIISLPSWICPASMGRQQLNAQCWPQSKHSISCTKSASEGCTAESELRTADSMLPIMMK